ncbi:hypothetical protein GCM10010873_27770 [Cypionkella aquatica]|uniref:Hedgehog/Intein (Hint) domain-containing protein n=1 Tax=Cypionkella aquatica TaxID=1756042 RepID=A0AA37TXY1_9RHOB|nr:Hint domain-containing protein [Cypionkella aquatica]GLS87803.1 hypothetical protein GCM10010873_27770 [Cypionkella aquatica]
MPVFALFNFNDVGTDALDSAPAFGDQLGTYRNGATSTGGQAVLDGQDDLVKIYQDPSYQMDRGTLDIQFTLADQPLTATQTVLSRDSAGDNEGSYRIEIQADGSVVISHETGTGTETFGTAAGFANPGDTVSLSYSWDEGGAGGALQINNLTSTATFNDSVPNTLTMDMGAENQPWIVGAGQSLSDASSLDNIDQHFAGSVDTFQLSDSVDNYTPERDGYVDGTIGGDLIDTSYTGDPDGDRIDNNDAILSNDGPNDDRVRAGDGNDTVYAGLGDDSVEASRGDDLVYGGVGDDTLLGGSGTDTLYGGDGSDLAYGGGGNDVIDTRGGGAAALPDQGYPGLYPSDATPLNDLDTVYGGAGDDTIYTGDDADSIHGGGGNDYIDAGIDNDTIEGNQGNDTIIGAEGADEIYGGQGDDLIYGGYGPGVPDAVNIPDVDGDLLPLNGNDYIEGGLGNDTIYGMDDDDTIDGGQGSDYLDGGIDNDVITGGLGNDTLIGGQGADTLSGGADRDLFIVGANGEGYGDVIDGNEQGDDYDTLDLTGSGPLHINYDPNNAENGTVDFFDADGNVVNTLTFQNIENVIPCFTPGTLIATPRGEIPVELLKAGDRVITRDNGIQEIRWTGRKDMGWHDLAANPHLKPVLIRQGSLGNGLPERDMMVSPNHRVLVANDRTALYFDEHEVLVSAKHLVAGKGIDAVNAVGASYIHFMFDRHEVVLSNGAWTESFQPGDYTLKGMGNAQRGEIFDLFPELKTEAGREGYSAARRTLKRHEAMLLVK